MSVFEDCSDKILDQIDWDNLLDACDLDALLDTDVSHPRNYSNPSPDSVTSTIKEIENFLMNDDECSYDLQSSVGLCDNFLADVIVDSPSLGKVSTGSDHGDDTSSEKAVSEKVNDDEFDGAATAGPDDPISKKRRRQLRNRDAAVRSRERRKMYVRDLELKSKYLEAECRRLGRTLQCYVAENQALQLSLQAFGVSSTKQESAVLLLESLLLGSLLWFLGIMCLSILPSSIVVPVAPEEGGKMAKNVDPRGGGSDNLTLLETPSFLNIRRCKASRTRMRTYRIPFSGHLDLGLPSLGRRLFIYFNYLHKRLEYLF